MRAVNPIESAGMGAASAHALLDRLHAEITLPRIMVNNLRIFCVSGTGLSVLVAIAFVGR